MEHLVLRIRPSSSAMAVLEPYEKKGFEVVGMKSQSDGSSVIALRGSISVIIAGRALAEQIKAAVMPHGATLQVSTTAAEALAWMYETLGNPREVVQWASDEEDVAWKVMPEEGLVNAKGAPYGSHMENCERIRLSDLLAPGALGSAIGQRFCAQLKRDSYVPLVVSAAERELFEVVEHNAAEWFAQDEDTKDAQGGVYGHVDRKFTGYRNGKFREQLEVRQTLDRTHGGLYPKPEAPKGFGDALSRLVNFLDASARGLLRHVAVDVGADDGFFEGLLDPPPSMGVSSGGRASADSRRAPPTEAATAEGEGPEAAPPALGHSLIRLCRYDADSEGVYGSHVLCEEHNDVGFITLDACASVAGLEALRRADNLWVPVETAPSVPHGELVVLAMVGDTLGRLTANYYAPCKHRVVQPPTGMERIGLPFLFRGRSDAVLNTLPTRTKCQAEGRVVHLAEMETTTIKELPAFDSAKSILRGWFASRESLRGTNPRFQAE